MNYTKKGQYATNEKEILEKNGQYSHLSYWEISQKLLYCCK